MNTFSLMRDAFPVGFPIMSAILGGIVGSFLGVVAERVPGMVMDEEEWQSALSGLELSGVPARTCRVGKHPAAQLAVITGTLPPVRQRDPAATLSGRTDLRLVFGITAWCMPDVQALFSLWLLAAFYCRWP